MRPGEFINDERNGRRVASLQGGIVLEAPGWRRRPRHKVSLVEPDTFAARLNRLFDTVYPPGRGPYCSEDLVHALAMRGLRLSSPYLSQLRSGQRVKPSLEILDMIAEFFGIRSDYFTDRDEAYRRHLEDELSWLELTRNPGIRRLSTALAELDPDSREQLMAAAGI